MDKRIRQIMYDVIYTLESGWSKIAYSTPRFSEALQYANRLRDLFPSYLIAIQD